MKLLVIDIQKGITDSRLFNFEAFIDDTIRIIKAARDNQIEVIYFQHDDGSGTGFSIGDEDFEIAEQVIPREGEKIFIKNINSCFGNKDFTDYVKDDNTLMIVGLQTNFCIDATVKSAFERGYKVIVPQGANSTFDNDYMTGEETYKYYNDMMWPKRFATCVSVDEEIKLMESSIEIGGVKMQKIKIKNYSDCKYFADDIKFGKVYPLSIAQLYQYGDIFTKSKTEFKTFLFWHYSGFAFVSGEYDECFLEMVYDIISNRYRKNNRRFILINGDERIIEYFKTKENITIERRYFFEYDQSYNKTLALPNNSEIKDIDSELISKIHGGITPYLFWSSAEDFLSKGKGYCVVINDIVVAWAFSAAISDEEIDIGVETNEKYRGMGLAAIASTAMINYILSENKKPVWACHSMNTSSAKLAEKMGFKKTSECSIIKSKET